MTLNMSAIALYLPFLKLSTFSMYDNIHFTCDSNKLYYLFYFPLPRFCAAFILRSSNNLYAPLAGVLLHAPCCHRYRKSPSIRAIADKRSSVFKSLHQTAAHLESSPSELTCDNIFIEATLNNVPSSNNFPQQKT